MKQSNQTVIAGFGVVGGVAGIMVAFQKNSKLAGGIGLFIVGTIVGAAVGFGLTKLVPGGTETKTEE